MLAEREQDATIAVVPGCGVVLSTACGVHIFGMEGRRIASLAEHHSACLIGGSHHILCVSCFEVDEVDAGTGQIVRRVLTIAEEDSDEFVAVLALSADRAVVWTRETGLVLRDLVSGEALRCLPLKDPGSRRATLLVHPDGRRVLAFAADTDSDIVVWDIEDGRASRLDGSDRVSAMAIAPNGRHLAVATQYALIVVDLETGATVSECTDMGCSAQVVWLPHLRGVTYGQGPLLVVAASDRLLIVDALADEPLFRAPLVGGASGLAITPSGGLCIAGSAALSRWEVVIGPRSFEIDDRSYTSVLWDRSRDAVIVSGWGLSPQRWDPGTGRFCGPFLGEREQLRGELLAVDAARLHVYRRESVEVININTGAIVGGVHEHGFDSGGRFIRRLSDTRTRLLFGFPPYAALYVAELHAHGCVVLDKDADRTLADAVLLDPAGTMVVSGHLDGTVRVHDVATRTTTRTIATGTPVSRIAVGRSSIHVGHGDGRISVWDAASGAALHAWQAHPLAVHVLALDTDSDHFASASAESVRVWCFPAASDRGPVLVGEERTTTRPEGLMMARGRVFFVEAGRLVMLVV